MPAGEPVLGSGSSNGQPLGDDLENSNTGSGHARKVAPAPDAVAAMTAPAQPSGLRLHGHRREPLNPRRDLCPET